MNTLRRAFAEGPGLADYGVYWIRKAHDHLPAGTATDPGAGRAGLVGTQNLRNHQSRMDGLEHVVKTGANPLKDAPAGTEPNPADVNKPGDVSQLTAEEQMAPYEKELKENDWGHQPC